MTRPGRIRSVRFVYIGPDGKSLAANFGRSGYTLGQESMNAGAHPAAPVVLVR
jgi:hypothetical protein